MAEIATIIAGIKMNNPVMVASGTFGCDYEEFVNLNELGAIITKSVTLKPKEGNPPPRICETPSGMLNTIGLQNPGIDEFLKKDMKCYGAFTVPLIVNIAGETPEEYFELAKILDKEIRVNALEINVSCPNVKKGCMSFGVDPIATRDLVRGVKKQTKKSVIIKLTPNVTDIKLVSKAAEDGGADAISAINTVLGMSIDIQSRRPKLSMGYGGLSGPAIKPIAVRMVNEIFRTVKIPVIGIGGILTADDAIEFILAGASAIQVGTGNFINPNAALEIAEGIHRYLAANKIKSVKDLVGQVKI